MLSEFQVNFVYSAMEIIPERCVSILPFGPEAIETWTDETDLLQFMYALFEKTGTITNESGEQFETNYRSYGKYLCEHGAQYFRGLAEDFARNAQNAAPAPAAANKQEPTPDFWKDNQFGAVAKYHVAWNGIVSEVLSESAFFSIAHVLESTEELASSILLASNLYYKQALQVLRSFLEAIVVQLYFCENQTDFASWKSNQFRVPSFRRRDGMIQRLLSRRIIPDGLAIAAMNLYGDLNSAIHGSENRLIHSGMYKGDWSGHIFRKDRYEEWCRYFASSVATAIPLMRIHMNEWQRLSSTGTPILRCDVCHNTSAFDVEESTFGGRAHSTVNCKICGNSMTMDSEALRKRERRST
jgi:hypothetical protein